MSTPSLIAAYTPRDTWLHRLTPGPKLAGFFIFSVLAVAFRSPATAVAALAISTGLVLSARHSWRSLLRSMRILLIMAAALMAFHTWQHGWARGFAVAGTLIALFMAASALTATTAPSDLLDTITRALGPFRRFGVRPERVALTMSLMLTAIPGIMGLAVETRHAAKARGLDRSIRAIMTPLVLRVIARARTTGEALAARGLDD